MMKADGGGCPGGPPGGYGWLGHDAAAPARCENQRLRREKGREMANPRPGSRGTMGTQQGQPPGRPCPGELTAANPGFSA